jgi:hypothetical protein
VIEASPGYLMHPLVPYRVRGLLPAAPLIVVLRDPVDRALSAHHHQMIRGRETLSFGDAIAGEEARLAGELEKLESIPLYKSFHYSRHGYLMRGRYAEQLERWFSVFPREQFLILDTDSLQRDTERTMNRVCEFLDLSPIRLSNPKPVGSRRYEAMTPETRLRLQEYFAPHNDRLFELLGERFDWQSPGDGVPESARGPHDPLTVGR